MPPFRYNRHAKCYRNWASGFSLTIDGVTFEKIDKSKDGSFDGFPVLVWCQVEAETMKQALAIGKERCIPAIDAAVLVIGYRIDDLEVENAHSLPFNPKDPGTEQIFLPLVYNMKPPTNDEQQQLSRQASKVQLPIAHDAPSETVRRAMKWYAESVRESDVIDKYMKLFVTLNMFVPYHTSFVEYGADILSEQFATKTTRRRHIRACLDDLYEVRNDLFHGGLVNSKLSAAVPILERIVRAMVRRKLGLDDEFMAGDLFKKVAEHESRKKQGSFYGWPIPVSKP